MENKYYTPEIEEFCVGFEYEYLEKDFVIRDGKRSYEYTWNKQLCFIGENYGFDLGTIEGCLDSQVRVKYLDQEDIESLGFTKTKEYSDELLFQKHLSDYEFLELTFYLDIDDDINVSIDRFYQSKMVARRLPIGKETWELLTIFHGKIKNKSEFKKLLKQL